MKKPDTDWDIIESEKVQFKQGYRSMPESEFELMEQSITKERMKRNENLTNERK